MSTDPTGFLLTAEDPTNPRTSGNSDVRFQIPVDWDGDNDAVTSAMNPAVEWGIYDTANLKANGRLNGWARYYVQTNQLYREILDSGLATVAGTRKIPEPIMLLMLSMMESKRVSCLGSSFCVSFSISSPLFQTSVGSL